MKLWELKKVRWRWMVVALLAAILVVNVLELLAVAKESDGFTSD